MEIVKLDAKLVYLVQEYLNGATIPELAAKYKMPESTISEFISRKEVKSYIANTLANAGYLNPSARINLLNRMIEDKIRFAEDANVPLSNKDLTEIIKLLQEEQKMISKVDTTETTINIQSEYTNLISSLVQK